MALIPQNLKLLNESQNKLEFGKNAIIFKLNFERMQEVWQFYVISHCLRTIPEFKAENPAHAKKWQEIEDLNMGDEPDNSPKWRKYGKLLGEFNAIQSTIASATLHGQGDFPPSTLEELCKSYKNVMSK